MRQKLFRIQKKNEKIEKLCLYFSSSYIKNFVPNSEVLFSPFLWNQRDAAVNGIAVEGWHFGIESYSSGAHPIMWKVVGSLQEDASVHKLTFFGASSGHEFTKKQKVSSIKCQFTKTKLNCIFSERYLVCVRPLYSLSYFCFFCINKMQYLIQLELLSAFLKRLPET